VAIDTLRQRMSRGDVIILDGATGTELERRGVPMDELAWSATALLTHPEVIREVHEDYIASGADIITTNTFGTLGLSLRSTTLAGRVSEVNRTAVRLAQEARARSDVARPIWIGGSMSGMIGTVYWRDAPVSREIIRDSYREQAELLAEAGVDLLLLEMTQDVEVGVAAIEAAKSTSLPVWVAFSCNFMNSLTGADRPLVVRGSDGRDRPLSEVIDPILAAGGDVAGINHTDVDIMGRALDVLIEKWRGPVSAYPNSGDWTPPNWGFDSVISPMEFATVAESWVARGVQVIGGCCGIGPDHIRLLRDRFKDRRVPVRSR
jgi:S-methylmethionine-dependent homocysteine/selenocysteine methylase